MMQWILFTLMFIMNFIFFFMKHPLAMGLTLFLQTSLISFYSGFTMKSYWFSYILFLVFLGGMLVLFIYVTSLASNEMFSFSMKIFMWSLIMMLISIITYMFFLKCIMNYKNLEINPLFNMNSFISENSLSLFKLYNFPMNMLTILLMNYLLLTLIAVVKITKLFKGPLRPMFN